MKKLTSFTSVFNKKEKYPIYNIDFNNSFIENLEKILIKNSKNRFDIIKLKKIFIFIDKKLSKIVNIPNNYENIDIVIKYETPKTKNDNGNVGKIVKNYINLLAKNNITPGDSLIVVIGGGGIINTIGFISSIYHRGLPLIYFPTTPLSASDVAVGSKTGLNNNLGKEIIGKHKVGTYFDPVAVCINNDFFKNLYEINKEAFVLNLAENIKHFILQDEEMLYKAINLINKILNNNIKYTKIEDDINEIISKTIQLKDLATIIDPFEHNYGKILLYGHKHSNFIESITNYEVPHDFSVYIGILIDLEIQKNIFGIEFVKLETFLLNILKTKLSKNYISKLILSLKNNNFNIYLNDIKGENENNLILKFIKIEKLGVYAKREKNYYKKGNDMELFNCDLKIIIESFHNILKKL